MEALQDSKEKLGQPFTKNQYEKIVSTVTQSVHRSIDLKEVLVNAVEAMVENIEIVEHVSIYFVEGKEAVIQIQRGFPDGFIEKVKRIPHPKGFTWNTILEGKTRYCPDVEKDTVIGPAGRKAGTKSYVSIPLKIESKTIGCINVHSFQKYAFDEEEIKLFQIIANQIEAAINNAKQAEALRNSEERYRALYDENPSMYFTISEEGNVLSVNQYGAEQLGYTAEELVGNSVITVFHEQDQASAKELLNNCFENPDQVFRWELRKVCKGGAVIWVNEIARCVWDAYGNKVTLVVCEDITEQKRMQDELEEEEEKYRTIVEHTYDLIIETDMLGVILYANPQHKYILGYDAEELIGTNCMELVHPEDRSEILASFQKAIQSGESVQTALYRCKHKNGDIRWLESTGRTFQTTDGEIRGVISSRDITERKKAEEEKRETEERHRTFVEHAYDIIIETCKDGKFTYLNPTFKDLLGYDSEEVLGKSIFEFIHPDDRLAVMTEFARAINTFTTGSAVYRFKHQNGQWCWLESTGKPFKTSTGDLRAVISTRDITERRKAEQELKNAFSEIEKLKNQLERENIYLQEEVKLQHSHGEIVAESKAMKTVLNLAEQVAGTESTVLLLGETGTGKELLANAIHNTSERRDRAIVMVSCAALQPNLIESELFGHEKGAFTGAVTKRTGRFEIADGSTIFLDEVAELPLELQSKLLRVLQEGSFERLGSGKTIDVDVRVLAATNKDLSKAVEEGSFREDLFYRLNVFPITIPPLRERDEDIPLLVNAFVNEFGERMGKNIENIPIKTMEALMSYKWPGNIRELRNEIERAVILSTGSTLQLDLPNLKRSPQDQAVSLEEVEINHVRQILDRTGWRVRGSGGAAEILGMKPTTLDSKMKKLGIKRDQSKY